LGRQTPLRVLGLFSSILARLQPDYPRNTLITGFPFFDRDDDQVPSGELLRFLDAGEPPILFTLGSAAVHVGEEFFLTSIEVAKQLKRRALLLVGDSSQLISMKLPDGIAAFVYAPHSLVMPSAVVNVHQGGIGTTGQALRAGRPMLVVLTDRTNPITLDGVLS